VYDWLDGCAGGVFIGWMNLRMYGWVGMIPHGWCLGIANWYAHRLRLVVDEMYMLDFTKMISTHVQTYRDVFVFAQS
jgi:hypothetical protein